MARTPQQIIEAQIGALITQLAQMQASLEAKEEQIAALQTKINTPAPSDHGVDINRIAG